MEKWEQTLDALLNSNITGFYQYCKVDQIVFLENATGIAWNYFTHVHFSNTYTAAMESELLRSPASIGKKFKLYVSRYVMDKERFRKCVQGAVTSGFWNYTDSKLTEGVQIDGAFIAHTKYVAENDPTGSIYGNVIPLEKSIYNSTFMGNYYIFEIYGRGDHQKKVLTKDNIRSIQAELYRCKLNYHLDELSDRIGNIICRVDIENFKATPVKLGAYGMVHNYELQGSVKNEITVHFHIEQEHDRLLYEYSDEEITLKPGECITRGVDPNQCKTTITVTDKKTNLILFRIVSDQSVYSNYRGQITPGTVIAAAPHDFRKITLEGKEISIPLSDVRLCGDLEFLIEMADAGERQQRWEDKFFKEQKYLKVYHSGAHDEAISDIRSILNKQLLWDLQEVLIIDPYLSPKDILSTAAFCEKRDICVRCLTDLHTISGNQEAKKDILSGEDAGANNYETIRAAFKKKLEDSIGTGSDLCLSFRSVHGNNGSSFHDRYLILKYNINKTRAWSLGTSINSVGKSHHIIQIVESPMLIENFFNQVWHETESKKCRIYDYSDYITLDEY